MRIAVVADAFPTVSETFVLDQAHRLAARGHDVVVVGDRPAVAAELPPSLAGRTRHRRPVPSGRAARVLAAAGAVAGVARRSPARAARFTAALTRARGDAPLGLAVWAAPLVAEGPFDAVIAHFGWNARRAALVRPALDGAALVAVLHGADLSSWAADDGPQRFAPIFAEADLVLPVSERWRRQVLEWGAPAAKVVVHRVGIELGPPAGRDEPAGGPLRLLSVARLVEKKGIETAVRAVAAAGVDCRYDVVGDGPLRPSLEALAADLGVAGRITFHGAQPPSEVAAHLAAADVLVAPSVTASDGDQEGIPVAIMEAMAAGLPVLSTHHSGIPELVEHGVTGLLVAERDVEGLAAAIVELAADPARCRALGAAGREAVAARHDADRLIGELEDHLLALRTR